MYPTDHLTVYDPDTVELHNVEAQGWEPRFVGQLKVTALRAELRRLRSLRKVKLVPALWGPSVGSWGRNQYSVIYICVDSMNSRRLIQSQLIDRHWVGATGAGDRSCVVDGRVGGTAVRVLRIVDSTGMRHYPHTLVEMELENGCTSRFTQHIGVLGAGLMVEVGEQRRWGDSVDVLWEFDKGTGFCKPLKQLTQTYAMPVLDVVNVPVARQSLDWSRSDRPPPV